MRVCSNCNKVTGYKRCPYCKIEDVVPQAQEGLEGPQLTVPKKHQFTESQSPQFKGPKKKVDYKFKLALKRKDAVKAS